MRSLTASLFALGLLVACGGSVRDPNDGNSNGALAGQGPAGKEEGSGGGAGGTASGPATDAGGPRVDASVPAVDAGSGPGCASDGQCAAPAVCQVCADGSYACATAACVSGQCQVVYPPCAAADAGAPIVSCGGFVGKPCPGAGTCVDVPGDGCDPQHGGADCPGQCACSGALAKCAPGYVFDDTPSVCTCVAQGAVDGGAAPQCASGDDCPKPKAPCKLCADGKSSSCPEATCQAGQCGVAWTTCP